MTNSEIAWSPSSEVAFVTQTSESEVDRLVDDGMLPSRFCKRSQRREFDLVGTSVSVTINHDLKHLLTRNARKVAIETWMERHYSVLLAEYKLPRKTISYDVVIAVSSFHLGAVSVNLEDSMGRMANRLKKIHQVHETVVSDPEILGGLPVIRGSRLPIENLLATVDEGVPFDIIQDDYPFLTPEMIEHARLYQQTHPRRGRPRRSEQPEGMLFLEFKHGQAGRKPE
jgi:uncharacterized protein (DUF433 family)